MLILSLSDLHLGKGKFLKNGQLNILEDFFEDQRFYEFCEFYSSDQFYSKEVHLVLNGDILNLIQIDFEGVFTHIIDEKRADLALKKIIKGHPIFFDALKLFLSTPNKKVSYVIGNHDASMDFELPQMRLNMRVDGNVHFCHVLEDHGVHIEHGHRFEAINSVPQDRYYSTGPNGKRIINLPWGSLFCISVLPQLKKDRPYLDKVRPMGAYIKWCLFHDLGFFLKMSVIVIKYLIESNFDTYIKDNRNFKTSLKILKQITIYPRYEKKAKSILKRNITLHTVVMGHTHLQEWRRFPEGKYYFNTGTWNPIPSIDAGLHQDSTCLSYCMLDIHKETSTLREGSLCIWQGKWRPFTSEISTN
ncbi:hypothetical protein [Halobacteriovorax sp. JY17]|uniref:hypothetical protein n=1 Tax=Halobacteriovorax sp. JY17 TaxID=2014617 RepID=UPI000C55CD65|nr:hypothetical protein [Halobacteriovorax sp. JY17]PIK15334.1 MAG: hypothetical protein CES88_01065 [Halobacteriovorax sp. JY17]